MKTCCVVLVMLFSVSSFGQMKEKRSIFILSVNFFTTTIISVPCESFATQFERQIKTNEVYAEDSIIMLDKFIKSIKFSKNQKEFDLDTKAKMIYKNVVGDKVTICTDGFNVLINGNLVKKNKSFLRFILSLIPEQQQRRRNLLPH